MPSSFCVKQWKKNRKSNMFCISIFVKIEGCEGGGPSYDQVNMIFLISFLGLAILCYNRVLVNVMLMP